MIGQASWQRNYVVLNDGGRVRYTLFRRAGSNVYLVRFRHNGKCERSTGRIKKADAISEAHRIILEEFGPAAATLEAVPWEAAREKLKEAMEADAKRPRTVAEYLKSLKRLPQMFPQTQGPSDVTPDMASDFKTNYAKGVTVRKKKLKRGEKAKLHRRRPETLDSQLRMLKAAFGWLVHLRLAVANPFERVELPELDRREVKFVRPEDVAHFFDWLEERYPGWSMPPLFFSVKAATACRLQDVCSLRSDQLQDGRLVFTANVTKNRSERYAILPADLYAALNAYKGPTYLWERYPAELIAINQAKGNPTHRQKPDFTPQRLYFWVLQLMGYYQKATGRMLRSHDFRRAAFTRAAEKDIHPKRAAVAFDVTPETMLRYYTATEKKRTADEVLGGLAGDLLPKRISR